MQQTQGETCYYVKGYGSLRRLVQSVFNDQIPHPTGESYVENIDTKTENIPHFKGWVYAQHEFKEIAMTQPQVETEGWHSLTPVHVPSQLVYCKIRGFARLTIDDEPDPAGFLNFWETCSSILRDVSDVLDEFLDEAANDLTNRVYKRTSRHDEENMVRLAVVGIRGRRPICIRMAFTRGLCTSGPGTGCLNQLLLNITLWELHVGFTDLSQVFSTWSYAPGHTYDMGSVQAQAHVVLGAPLSLCIPRVWTDCTGCGKRLVAAKKLAFVMGMHHRLGQDSSVLALDEFLVYMIFQFVDEDRKCGINDVSKGIFYSQAVRDPFLYDPFARRVIPLSDVGL